jgi:hypothetical protein
MAHYQLIVFSNPVAGQEEAFDRWYTQTHILDLLKVPGVRTAQRHAVLTDLSRAPLAGFVTEYAIESGDIAATIGEIRGRLGTAQMPMIDAFDRSSSSFIVAEPVGPLKHSPNADDPAASVQAVSFVFSSPVAGREAEYQQWYDGTHVDDLLRVPGYRSGQRLRVLPELSRNVQHAVVARYAIHTPDLAATMATARSRLGTPEMVLSPAFDMAGASFNLTRPLTEQLVAA